MSWPEKWVPGFSFYYCSLVVHICDHRLFCAYSIFHNQKTGLKVPDILIKKGCIATKYVTHHETPRQVGNKGNIVIILQRRNCGSEQFSKDEWPQAGSFCLQNPCTFLCTGLWVAMASIITVLLPRRKESERRRVLLKVSQEFITKRAGVNNLTLKSSSFQHTWLNPVNYRQGETGIYVLVPKGRIYTKSLQLILFELVSPIHAAVEDGQEDRIMLITVVCI